MAVTETGFAWPQFHHAAYGFNLGAHVGDKLIDVQARRALVQAEMGAPVVWLNQVHGGEVFTASEHVDLLSANSTPPVADASICTHSNTCLAIMTADCLPVVFAAFDTNGCAVAVAAAHAGWRGLHLGVLQSCVAALSGAAQVPAQRIKAWLGPAIGPESFEVGHEVFDAFTLQNKFNKACFKQGVVSGKYFADIYALARIALNGAGVHQITGGGLDTLKDSRWFSHRRGQQQGGLSGRFATLIRLLP